MPILLNLVKSSRLGGGWWVSTGVIYGTNRNLGNRPANRDVTSVPLYSR